MPRSNGRGPREWVLQEVRAQISASDGAPPDELVAHLKQTLGLDETEEALALVLARHHSGIGAMMDRYGDELRGDA
jgi:hypothetical protein